MTRKKEEDLGARQQHHFYFRNGTMDFYVGWLLGYSQLGGLSPGALYDCLNQIDDGRPRSWIEAFRKCLAYQQEQAEAAEARGGRRRAAQHNRAAAVAARAALNFTEPGSPDADGFIDAMERSFQASLALSGSELEPWDVPFRDARLPAYVSRALADAPILFVVVGGGDTYREDLWYFAGCEAERRGYAVLMADLPGQGKTPNAGLHFGPDTIEGLNAALLGARARGFKGKVVLCGFSGGGLFTAKYLELHGGVAAWIASTPIEDIARMFEQALPGVLRRNPHGMLAHRVLTLAGRLSPVLDASIKKYDWQFGPGGVPEAVERFRTVGKVDLARLDAPLLALVGTSEARESQVQARRVFEATRTRNPTSRLIELPPASGGDAHCQVNNLPLMLELVFEWLQEIGLGPDRMGSASAPRDASERSTSRK